MISAALAVLNSAEERNIVSELYEENSQRFYAIAFRRLNNRAQAEDAVQEAFLRIADKPQGLINCPVQKRVAYVDVVIRNVAVEMFRKRTAHEMIELADDIPDGSCSVEDIALGRITEAELVDFILTIPQAKREALQLRAFNHLSNAEIAQALGITEAAARKRISDAMKLIRDFVKGAYYDRADA